MKMEKMHGDKVIRFSTRANEPNDKTIRRNGYDKRDDRHNVNNFLVVHMKRQQCDMGKV